LESQDPLCLWYLQNHIWQYQHHQTDFDNNNPEQKGYSEPDKHEKRDRSSSSNEEAQPPKKKVKLGQNRPGR
jgi:hypothetical protein